MTDRPDHRARGVMRCPRCETGALDERERDGILVDVCRACRGIWLDRGELEKLIAQATRELDERVDDDGPPRAYPRPDSDGDRAPAYRRPDSDSGHHALDHDRDQGRHGRKKKRWFDSFGDLFD
jgi:Zn-finger nucleic acid-binding protein